MLDVRPGAHDRASFERAVEACASIATALERAGRPFEVILSTGVLVGAPGRRHLATVMDELAVVEPHGPDRIVATTTRRRTSALVAVMGRMRGDDSGALSVLVRDGGMLTVVDDDARRRGRLGAQPPLPTDRRAVRPRRLPDRLLEPDRAPMAAQRSSPLSASPARA